MQRVVNQSHNCPHACYNTRDKCRQLILLYSQVFEQQQLVIKQQLFVQQQQFQPQQLIIVI
jgi:hypothetical protein